jgi:hypothetical protein
MNRVSELLSLRLLSAYRFSGTISETMVLKTPIFPFKAPAQNRKKNATPSDLENPIPSADKDDPPSPISKTRFLPKLG